MSVTPPSGANNPVSTPLNTPTITLPSSPGSPVSLSTQVKNAEQASYSRLGMVKDIGIWMGRIACIGVGGGVLGASFAANFFVAAMASAPAFLAGGLGAAVGAFSEERNRWGGALNGFEKAFKVPGNFFFMMSFIPRITLVASQWMSGKLLNLGLKGMAEVPVESVAKFSNIDSWVSNRLGQRSLADKAVKKEDDESIKTYISWCVDRDVPKEQAKAFLFGRIDESDLDATKKRSGSGKIG